MADIRLSTRRKFVSGKLIELFEGVWRYQSCLLGVHHPCQGYLLHCSDEWWLIDPPRDLDREVLARFDRSVEISRILITHWQEEHVAGVGGFPGARIHASAGDGVLAGGTLRYSELIVPWAEPWDWENLGNFPGHLAGARNERPLDIGVLLDEPLHSGPFLPGLEVISTPGHGKHAVTLVVERNGAKLGFCGDLIFGQGQLWNWFDCDWDYGHESGQRALRDSAWCLMDQHFTALLPAHGEVILRPRAALKTLIRRLDRVLSPLGRDSGEALNRVESGHLVAGFRQLSSCLYQLTTGNMVVIASGGGDAIVVDDGMCIWQPPERRQKLHDEAFGRLKSALGITKISWIIPTHYHGDHIDGMARLAQTERARIIALESISGPMERPGDFNLAAALPWYGIGETGLLVDLKVPEGFTLPWRGLALQFFRLGGQTWHHQGIQIFLDGLNVLLVGDAWWGTSTEPKPVLTWNEAVPESQGWVFALDRMIERRPDLLVCGHGSALFSPMPILLEARRKWNLRLNGFRKLNSRKSSELFFNPFLESGQNGPKEIV